MNDTGGIALSGRSNISVVIPVYNEEDNVLDLHRELSAALSGLAGDHEIIFIDDGSTDGTHGRIRGIADPRVRVVRFQKNYGKSAALSCGFAEARGDVVVTMDGDLQDSPAELPKLLDGLKTYDIVSGWKRDRHDPLTKTVPSRIFNVLTAWLSGVRIHDFNSGYKAYRKDVVKNIRLYGEMHRYIPVIASWQGYRTGEVAIEHRARARGKSKYGMTRLFKGLFDLITVMFLMTYKQRPMHLFGTIGGVFGGIGTLICAYLLYLWLHGSRIGDRPLLTLGVLLITLGVQFFALGLIGELIASTRNEQYWTVRKD